MKKKPLEELESQEFYELMQNYRHAPLAPQHIVVDAFEEVKKYIRALLSAPPIEPKKI